MTSKIRRITPNLWFDTQAEEAARHYVSIFENSSIGTIARYAPEGPALTEMITDPDAEKAGRVLKALQRTKSKIDIRTLVEAYEG